MLDATDEILSFLVGTTYEYFTTDRKLASATIKQLEVIGEAAAHVTDQFKLLHPEIQWREIIGLRNILVHEYFDIDFDLIWNISNKNVPRLQQELKAILTQFH
ncbi:MAG: DUF86 domain-containing protein [Ignavibacteriae bacterium]|nr:DUF86 domain-containing protein [Ignavibacteriota bacterium]